MVLVMRIVTADIDNPRRIAGTIIWLKLATGSLKEGVYSRGGDQRHHTLGNTITSVPNQKLGTASIRGENDRAT